jgi:16S rRNA U1498 N3-methylase RsmE
MRPNQILVEVKGTTKKQFSAKVRCQPEMSCKPPSEISIVARTPKGKHLSCQT